LKRVTERIFTYTSSTVSANFIKASKIFEIDFQQKIIKKSSAQTQEVAYCFNIVSALQEALILRPYLFKDEDKRKEAQRLAEEERKKKYQKAEYQREKVCLISN
jgi:hypothetical protein